MSSDSHHSAGPKDGHRPNEVQTPSSKELEQTVKDQVIPPKLSPEEQMALFEKELKENDWGHQPC